MNLDVNECKNDANSNTYSHAYQNLFCKLIELRGVIQVLGVTVVHLVCFARLVCWLANVRQRVSFGGIALSDCELTADTFLLQMSLQTLHTFIFLLGALLDAIAIVSSLCKADAFLTQERHVKVFIRGGLGLTTQLEV